MTDFVEQKYIKSEVLEEREYQSELFNRAKDESTLIALPTGSGKTPVAIRVMMHRLAQAYDSFSKENSDSWKVLMLAPTTELVRQHANSITEFTTIPESEVSKYTGDTRPAKRPSIWEGQSVVIATPQVVKNDLLNQRISIDNVVNLVVDECHNVTEGSSYAYVAEKYYKEAEYRVTTGLSATPGESKEDIAKVVELLHINRVESFVRDDEEVGQYLASVNEEYEWVDMPEAQRAALDAVQNRMAEVLAELKDMGVTNYSSAKSLTQSKLRRIQGQAAGLEDGTKKGMAFSRWSELQSEYQLSRSIQQNPPDAILRRFKRLEQKAKRADSSKWESNIVNNQYYRDAKEKLESFDSLTSKQSVILRNVISTSSDGGQTIIFTESRDTAQSLTDFINQYELEARRFVGQSDREDDAGMSTEEQKETIEDYRAGEFDVLVATSVAEEGLDIPSVDLVIFHEPVSRGVRYIQRIGRTGREDEGRVIILITRDSVEETTYYSMKNRAESANDALKELRDMEGIELHEIGEDEDDGQQTLDNFNDEIEDTSDQQEKDEQEATESDVDADSFASDEVVILADTRETSSGVVEYLDLHSTVTQDATNQLEVGDYILSDRAACERKSMDDFIATLTGNDERDLFEQMNDLASNYSRPLLILEGDLNDLYARNIPEGAIHGALTALYLGFGICIMPSRSPEDTGKILERIARREQEENDRTVQIRSDKQTMGQTDEQEYIVASIGNVGTVTARALLTKFGSVREVFTADKDELMKVEGVGSGTAEHIQAIATANYAED